MYLICDMIIFVINNCCQLMTQWQLKAVLWIMHQCKIPPTGTFFQVLNRSFKRFFTAPPSWALHALDLTSMRSSGSKFSNNDMSCLEVEHWKEPAIWCWRFVCDEMVESLNLISQCSDGKLMKWGCYGEGCMKNPCMESFYEIIGISAV